MERRRHQRLPIHLPGELDDRQGHHYPMETNDLSFGGALLRPAGEVTLKCGCCCDLHLFLDPEVSECHLDLTVEVIDVRGDGIAVRLLATDLDGYVHFKNLMINRCPDPAGLLDELEQDPVLFGG